MTTALLVVLGAAVGAVLRYVAAHLLDRDLPWGTVLVNVSGSFLIGVVSGLGAATALLAIGFAGALTTYSGFAVQAYDAGWRRGVLTVLLTVPPALAACALGYAFAR